MHFRIKWKVQKPLQSRRLGWSHPGCLFRMGTTGRLLSVVVALSVGGTQMCSGFEHYSTRISEYFSHILWKSALTRLFGLIFLVSTFFSPVILFTDSWASFSLQKKERPFESLVRNLKNANDIWCVGVKNWANLGHECPKRGLFLVQETFNFTWKHLKDLSESHTSLWRRSCSPVSTWPWSRRKTQTKAWRSGHWSRPSPPPSALGQSTEPGPGSWRAQQSTKEDGWRSVIF